MLPNLQTLLQYKHPQVIRSYVRTFGSEESQAQELFTDMLKYLWISHKHILDRQKHPKDATLEFIFVMHEEMRNIDNMWHNFILYTKDYSDFCQQYFGRYLHHVPDVAEKISHTESEFSTDMEKYLSYVYDNLGEATVCRWFAIHLADT